MARQDGQDVCQRHGITYHVHPNIRSAFCSHVRHLSQMGKLAQPLELEMG
jgi:hypothetical protein